MVKSKNHRSESPRLAIYLTSLLAVAALCFLEMVENLIYIVAPQNWGWSPTTWFEYFPIYLPAALASLLVGRTLYHFCRFEKTVFPEARYFHNPGVWTLFIEVIILPILGVTSLFLAWHAFESMTMVLGTFVGFSILMLIWSEVSSSGLLKRVALSELREDICTTQLQPGRLLDAVLIRPMLWRMAILAPMYPMVIAFLFLDIEPVNLAEMGLIIMIVLYLFLFHFAAFKMGQGNLMRASTTPAEQEYIPGGMFVSNFGWVVLTAMGVFFAVRFEALLYSWGPRGYFEVVSSVEAIMHLVFLIFFLLGLVHRSGEATTAAHLGFLQAAEIRHGSD